MDFNKILNESDVNVYNDKLTFILDKYQTKFDVYGFNNKQDAINYLIANDYLLHSLKKHIRHYNIREILGYNINIEIKFS